MKFLHLVLMVLADGFLMIAKDGNLAVAVIVELDLLVNWCFIGIDLVTAAL